jgi:hypothetical protein
MLGNNGWEAGIRTPISRVRVWKRPVAIPPQLLEIIEATDITFVT